MSSMLPKLNSQYGRSSWEEYSHMDALSKQHEAKRMQCDTREGSRRGVEQSLWLHCIILWGSVRGGREGIIVWPQGTEMASPSSLLLINAIIRAARAMGVRK